MKTMSRLLSLLLIVTACSKPSSRPQITTKVSKQNILQKVTIAGNIEPNNKVSVVAPYDGYVKKLFVKVGETVKKGQNLVVVAESLTYQGPFFPLKAPTKGVVVQVNKSEGEFARKGDLESQILRIDDLSELFVNALAPELDFHKIKVGQKVKIRATSINDQQFTGRVKEIFLAAKSKKSNWGGDRSAPEFPVKIEVLDEDDRLKPGMSVIVDIVANQKDEVLALPHDYVFSEEGKYFVNLAGGKQQEIKVGARDERHIEVVDLEEGTEVRQINFYESKK